MTIIEATAAYERWAAERIDILAPDIALKHRTMSSGEFPFLRATFYRWALLWSQICPQLAAAPAVLAVGDLHIENFGTWRDAEGRLAWGVNDFDEAFPIAYTNDLVRLATSVLLAARESALSIRAPEACDAILTGYRQAIERGSSEPSTAFVTGKSSIT